MELRQMEYFVCLAEEQQFTRAAALCAVSQSGLSASMRSLEAELGAPLFLRTTRRVDLTEAGVALLPYARSMLAQAWAGRDAVVRAAGQLSGVLRVGAEQCLGVLDVPPLLERFHARYPQVDIRFAQAGSRELAAQVRGGELDLAFVAASDGTGRDGTELGRRPVVLIAPVDDPLSAAGRVDWAALAERDFVDFRETWGVRALNDAAFAANGVHRRVRCTVDDVHTLLDLVHRRLGIAIVPQHVAAKPQAAGLRVLPLPDGTAPQWVVSAIVSPQADPSAARLVDLLLGATAEPERLSSG